MTIYTGPELFEDSTPSFGSTLGTALGGGISEGLKMLMKSKMDRMAQKEKRAQEQAVELQKFAQLQSLLGGGGAPGGAPPPETASRGAPTDFSDQQILKASLIDNQLGNLLQKQKDSKERGVASKFKETKETRKTIINQARAARENNTRLERMNVLNERDNLINPIYNATLKKLGLDIAALKNPDSQEFDKLTNDMFKNIREIFGNRISVIEIVTFLKTIPTLNQTQEGRRRVIRNLQLLTRGAPARFEIMREILKENGGVPPYDLGVQIEERASGVLDKMSSEFIGGLSSAPEIEISADEKKIKAKASPRVRNPKTGEILEWNGTQWKKVK